MAPTARRRWSDIERELRREHGPYLAGIDEVGRGPLAGPVVACAVVMPPDVRAITGVNDSKQLDAEDRLRLAVAIRARALAIGLGAASVREIERLNIYHATILAMRRALARLAITPHHVVVDGNPLRSLGVPHRAVVGGDARCYTVACASIIAKVTRDALMHRLAARYPGYGWHRNVGYATPTHLAGLGDLGPTRHHRRTFCSVAQIELLFAEHEAVRADGGVETGRETGEAPVVASSPTASPTASPILARAAGPTGRARGARPLDGGAPA